MITLFGWICLVAIVIFILWYGIESLTLTWKLTGKIETVSVILIIAGAALLIRTYDLAPFEVVFK